MASTSSQLVGACAPSACTVGLASMDSLSADCPTQCSCWDPLAIASPAGKGHMTCRPDLCKSARSSSGAAVVRSLQSRMLSEPWACETSPKSHCRPSSLPSMPGATVTKEVFDEVCTRAVFLLCCRWSRCCLWRSKSLGLPWSAEELSGGHTGPDEAALISGGPSS